MATNVRSSSEWTTIKQLHELFIVLLGRSSNSVRWQTEGCVVSQGRAVVMTPGCLLVELCADAAVQTIQIWQSGFVALTVIANDSFWYVTFAYPGTLGANLTSLRTFMRLSSRPGDWRCSTPRCTVPYFFHGAWMKRRPQAVQHRGHCYRTHQWWLWASWSWVQWLVNQEWNIMHYSGIYGIDYCIKG